MPAIRATTAKGWRVAELDGLPYPGLVPGDDGIAHGAVITDLTADEWTLLDTFENAQYEVRPVDVENGSQAYAYAVAGDLTPLDSAWNQHRFEREELAAYLVRCTAWRDHYDRAAAIRR